MLYKFFSQWRAMFSKNANITIYTNETSNQIHPKKSGHEKATT